jgi:hypothetical protein
MFLKRSLSLVLLTLCLSLSIGCSGDETDDSNGGGEEGAAAPNDAVNQVADQGDQDADNAEHEVLKPAATSLDLTYITDDFTSAVIAHPARVLNSEFMNELVKAGLPLDDFLKEPMEELGIDPRQVEQVAILLDKETASAAPQMLPIPFGPPGGAPGGFEAPDAVPPEELETPESSDQGAVDNPPAALQPVAFQPAGAVAPPEMVTVIVRFSAEMNPDAFFENFNGPPLEDAEIDGLKVKKLPFFSSVFYAADSKTLIYTQPKFLKKMVDAKSAESDLITELKNIDATHDLIVVVDLTPFRQLLQMAGGMVAAQLPPDKAALANIPNKTKMLTLTAGISNESLLSATFVMDTADDAQATNTALSSGLKQVQAMYEQQKTQGLPPNVPLDQAGQQEVIAMADEIVAGLSNEANGNRLTVTIPKPGDFNKLAALTKPFIEEARKAAELAEQKNNLRQIGIAFHNYHDVYGAFPGAGSDAEGKMKGLSWRVHLLPMLGEVSLYEQFNLDEAWDSEHNRALINQMPNVFKTAGVDDPTKTPLHVFIGDYAFSADEGRSIRDYVDGTSNSLLVVEAAPEKAEVWTKPGGLTLNEDDPPATLGEYSKDSFLALFADGSARSLSTSIDPETLKALITINGGEPVGGF